MRPWPRAESPSRPAREYDLVVNGIKDERDLARQVASGPGDDCPGVEAIVIAPADSKVLVSACKTSPEAGIVVVNIDNKLDDQVLREEGVQIPFVGPDNRAGPRMVGEYLAKKLKAGDQVAILEGVPPRSTASSDDWASRMP